MTGAAALALTALLLPAVATAAAVTGSFEGSGRACYGKLVVTQATASWATPASRCKRSAYRVIDDDSASRTVLQLKQPGRTCRTPVIVLQQNNRADPDTGWEAIGYPSLAAFKADDDASALGCALVRIK